MLLTGMGVRFSFAQRGMILDPATTNVMDPDGDGYVSISPTGFSDDGYYVDEFEFKMFGLPIFADGEVLNDIQSGAACGTTDLSVDTTGYSVYGVIDDFGNLIFRFRLAGDRPSVEAYTVLIDTDGKMGAEDPNSTANNPGFEIDVTLIKNNSRGVFVYNIDGIESCPSPNLSYSFATNYQKSIADIFSCGDEDYFLDFFVPFDDLASAFGITQDTEIRMIAVTNVSATCAMSGSISDIGGVDDDVFAGCTACAFDSLSTAQCPTSFNNLCSTCEGFKTGFTPKPKIKLPVKAETKVIVGTSAANATIYVDIYNSSSTLIDQDTVFADTYGNWVSYMDTILYYADSITARAQLAGKCRSGLSESDLAYAIVEFNIPTSFTAPADTLFYYENDGNVVIEPGFIITDPDDSMLVTASIKISGNYHAPEDNLIFTNQNGISGNFDPGDGTLTLIGFATLLNYRNALASISYYNNSEDPNVDVRLVMFTVKDTVDWSDTIYVPVKVFKVNDPPVISGDPNTLQYNDGDGTVIIDGTISISDLDNSSLTGAKVRIFNNYDVTEDLISFTDQLGITGSYNAAAATLTLTGTASLADYGAALSSITYTNSDPNPNQLTRGISLKVFDGTDSSNAFIKFIDMIATNSPPEIVDDSDNPIDTIYVSTDEDTPIETCLNVNDPDGDYVSIDDIISYNGNGTIDIDSLCFLYTPDPDFSGSDTLKIIVCDNAVPQYCDSVIAIIEIIPVNDPPQILIGGLPLDTLILTMSEDDTLNTCLDVVDSENNPVAISGINSVTGNGIFDQGATNDFCFDFIPDPDYYGMETGELVVCETIPGGLCDSITMLIEITPVNDAPQIVDEFNQPVDTIRMQIYEDTLKSVCVNATDPENDPILLTKTNSFTDHGTYDLGSGGDLCFNFVPDQDYTGEEFSQITVCDAGSPVLCDSAIIIFEILPVNDKPEITGDSITVDTLYFTTTEDIPLDICLDVADIEQDSVIISAIISQTGNGIFDPGSVDDLCFTFTPGLNYYGPEYGKLTVCEAAVNGLCDSIILVIDIIPLNDPPQIVDELNQPTDTIRIQMYEDSLETVCVVATDPEGDPITLSLPSTLTSLGSYNILNPGDMCFDFMPVADTTGEEYALISVCDSGNPSRCDSAILILDILPVNDKPEVTEDSVIVDTLYFTTQEDITLNICLDVADLEKDSVTISTINSLSGNGIYDLDSTNVLCFNFTPILNYFGIEYSQLIACESKVNGLCDTVILVVDITPVNDPPQILNELDQPTDTISIQMFEDSLATVCISAVDPEGDPVALSSPSTLTSLGSYDIGNPADMCFNFVPVTDTTGQEYALISVCDSGNPSRCDSAILLLEILPINDPPDIANEGISLDTLYLSTNEDVALEFCIEVTDPNGDALTVSRISPINANGTLDQTNSGGFCFLFSPIQNYFGQSAWNIVICDDGIPSLCDSLFVVIDILPVNDPPIAVNDTVSVLRNFTVSGNVLTNDSDRESDSLIVSNNPESPMHGNLFLQPGGGFEYSPLPSYFGIDFFTYTVCDNGIPSQCSSATVYIIVEDIPLVVYQGVSPNGDGLNDFLRIDGIEFFANNWIRIYDRYNNLVFESRNYNNDLNNWHGQSNHGLIKNDLPEDTYFYVINLGDGSPPISGFIMLKKEVK